MKTTKKSLLLVGIFVIGFITTVNAGTDVAIEVSQLPAKAQQTLSANFPKQKIALAKMEKEVFSQSYDVILTDGTKVEFDSQGEGTSVESYRQSVPSQFIPSQIKSEVKRLYGDMSIYEIERDKKGYEVKLQNGLELKFNKKMQLTDIDD